MRMKDSSSRPHVYLAIALAVTALFFFAVSSRPQTGTPAVTIISSTPQLPVQTNLVSDIPGLAATTDPNLIDPWGIADSTNSPYWISDQGTNKSTLYNGFGARTNLVVTVPPTGTPTGPTGIVSVPTGATGFVVPGSSPAATAHFIFATLDGNIAAWASGATATNAANITGAAFTGLAIASNSSGTFLYAANFVSGGTIQIFDSTFASTTLTGTFTDPNAVVGYAPFNIQLISGNLYVTYGLVGVPGGARNGAGSGYVDTFDTNGNFLQRLISTVPQLNAPWGITLAPAGFAVFPGDLLVGNFGNGEINAFNPTTGVFVGTISDSEGRPLVNNALWTIEFGNGNPGSNANFLYFTAGINGEQDGLFGSINPGPVSVIFGSQLIGALGTAQTVTVENTGNATLNLTAAPAISGTNSTDFAIGTTGTTCANGATIAPAGSCTITLTFTPGAAGGRAASLSIADNASSSPQILALSGTGTTGAPTVTIAPTPPLTFAGQLVTSTSAAQTVTITNSGNAPLTFAAAAISVSNDFAQTNTCNSATVAVSATCTVSVTFTPSSTTNNPRTGTLTIADNASNSPQTVPLSGTGWDFSVSTPSTASVTRGTPGTATVTVGALGGFTGSVALACSGTIPQGSCAVSPASVTAPGTATVTFTTTALLQPPATRRTPPVSPRSIGFLVLALASLLSLLAARRLRTRLSLVGAMLIFIVLAGCGTSSTPAPSTPAGQFPLTVTGTSGGASHSANLTLTTN